MEVGGDMASSKGQLNGEKPAGEGMVALPEKKTLPFRIGPPRRNAKLFGPDLGPAAPPKAEEKVPLAGGPCPKASAAEASQGPLDSRPGTAAAQGKRIESLRKETAQGRTKPGSGAKGMGKRKGAEGEELGEKGEQKMEESAEREVDVAEAKKGPGEALAAASWEKGDAGKGAEGALPAEVPAGGGREQGASGAAAEIKGSLEEAVGEGREHPEESSHSSKVRRELLGIWQPILASGAWALARQDLMLGGPLGVSSPGCAPLAPPKRGTVLRILFFFSPCLKLMCSPLALLSRLSITGALCIHKTWPLSPPKAAVIAGVTFLCKS